MTGQFKETADDVVAFGPFRLFVGRRQLLEGETPVRLGSRARDILVALLENPGQLSASRNCFPVSGPIPSWKKPASGFISRHCVVLLAMVNRAGASSPTFRAAAIASSPRPWFRRRVWTLRLRVRLRRQDRQVDIPAPLARMVGRSDVVVMLAEQLSRHRFVTIVGPGGIGKTTVALAVADSLLGNFADGIRFVDLAPLTDPQLVASALAALLGVGGPLRQPDTRLDRVPAGEAYPDRARQLRARRSTPPRVWRKRSSAAQSGRTFSRQAGRHYAPRASASTGFRPLTFPTDIQNLKAADALKFPSVQLFVERAAASLGSFELSDAEAPLVADICRRMDGIALAIEIAASRVDTFGIAGLAEGLNDRFQLLMQGRRTALPRHRTLSATLDWSYAQLPEIEQLVVRRLSIFAGTFTMDAASAVLAQVGNSAAETVEAISKPGCQVAGLRRRQRGDSPSTGSSTSCGPTRCRNSRRAASASGSHDRMPSTIAMCSKGHRPIGKRNPPRSGSNAIGI